MSPPGRPKGESLSAQREGSPMSPPGRPKGESLSAQREGSPVSPAPQSLPVRRAAALAYESAEALAGHSPRLAAKGQGLIAEQIIARARAAGVPVHESRELVSLLMQLDLDSHIPPALYVAVAEVLAWAYRLEHRTGPAA